MGYSPTERNPLGLSCSQPVVEAAGSQRLGSERLLLHTLSTSAMLHDWEGSSRSSMPSACCLSADGSEASSSSYSIHMSSSARHITRAKELLSEARCQFTSSQAPPVPFCSRSSALPRPLSDELNKRHSRDGSIGPLLALLYDCQDTDKVSCCLRTLAFLLLDEANRRELRRLGGLDILMDVLGRYHVAVSSTDVTAACATGAQGVLLAAGQAVAALVAQDPVAKASVWSHEHSGAILDLLSPRHSSRQLLEALALVSRLALDPPSACTSSKAARGSACCSWPVDSRLIGAVASLLHQAAPSAVLRSALTFLRQAAALGGCDARTWGRALLALVPLLAQSEHAADVASSSISSKCYPAGSCHSSCSAPAPATCRRSSLDGSVLEASVQLLSSLSDQPELHNALFAAGCLRPLLQLLSDLSVAVRMSAACILANMVEHPPAMQQLCKGPLFTQLLQTLGSVQCCEVVVGLLYTLSRLVALASPSLQLRARMRQQGAVSTLHRLACMHDDDQDVVLGAQQLLDLLD